MADQSYYSPNFKKPCDVLRMRRKRARSEVVSRSAAAAASSGPVGADIRPFSPGPLLNTHTRASGGVKRRNPFANLENTYNSPKKTRNCPENAPECPTSFSALCEGGKILEERHANSLPSLREKLFSSDSYTKVNFTRCGFKKHLCI